MRSGARRIRVEIGCTGWSIPAALAPRFPGPGSHLERYARALPAVEIASSFYRPHRPSTYARWAASVPGSFRFAVKLHGEITHERGLVRVARPLRRFLREEVAELGEKLGPVLVQLPPRLAFDRRRVRAFLETLRTLHPGPVVCEPRNPSWFSPEAEELLAEFEVARVAADPARLSAAGRPGGWRALAYFRLHGSPVTYRSTYTTAFLDDLARRLGLVSASAVWCIFDNTLGGAAAANALDLQDRLVE